MEDLVRRGRDRQHLAVGRDRVERGPDPLRIAAVALELHIVGDAVEGVGAVGLVEPVGVGIAVVLAVDGDIRRQHQLVPVRERADIRPDHVRQRIGLDRRRGTLGDEVVRDIADPGDGQRRAGLHIEGRGRQNHRLPVRQQPPGTDRKGVGGEGGAGQGRGGDILREGHEELRARRARLRRGDRRRGGVGGIADKNPHPPDRIALAVVREGPVGGTVGVVPDAEADLGVVVPVVEGEDRLLRAGVVDLHGTVVAGGVAAVAEVKGPRVRAGHVGVVRLLVVVRPELDVAGDAGSRLKPLDVAEDVQVAQPLLEVALLGENWNGDLVEIVGEGIHRHPDILNRLIRLLELQIVGDAIKVRRGAGAVVLRIDRLQRLGAELARRGDVKRIHEPVRAPLALGDIGLVPIDIGAEDGGARPAAAIGVRNIFGPHDVGFVGVQFRPQSQGHGTGVRSQRRGGDRHQVNRIILNPLGGGLHHLFAETEGDRLVLRRVGGGEDAGRRSVTIRRHDRLDHAEPGAGHQPITLLAGMEAVGGEGVRRIAGAIHIQKMDPLSLLPMGRNPVGYEGIEERLDIVVPVGVVGTGQERRRDDVRVGPFRGD